MTLLPVKQNLYDALKAFKEVGIGGLLWVDALCINQGDFDERAAQVALMDQLYSMATKVLIWLGPSDQGFKDLVLATKEFMPAYVGHLQSSTGASPNSILDPSWDKALGLKVVSTRLVNMALFYAACRWFTSAWVAQEVTLAKHAVILCGTDMLRFDDLSLLVELFINRLHVGFSQICSILHRLLLEEQGYKKRKLQFTFFNEVAEWTAFTLSDTNGGEWCLGPNQDVA
jgi:hypothetical protein